MPQHFHGEYEQAILERVESIIVDAGILQNGEVYTYGLGPEYNWLHWEEHPVTGAEAPAEVYESLSELISTEWSDDVRVYAEGDEAYLDGIHPTLRPAVAAVLAGDE